MLSVSDIGKELCRLLDEVVVRRAETQTRDHSYIHPSGIGRCARCITLEMLKDGSTPITDPQKLRIFENGHSFHERLRQELEEAGILVVNELKVGSARYNIGGHVDDIVLMEIEDGSGLMVLVDGKSANDKSYKYQTQHGLDHKYRDQVMLYMFLTGIRVSVVLMENKNDQCRHTFTVHYDEVEAKALVAKAEKILSHYFTDSIPEREAEYTRTTFSCKYCSYVDECYSRPKERYTLAS